MQVTINNKKYDVPELTFAHSKRFEQAGLPLEGIISKNHFFTAVSAFVQVVVGCDAEHADYLIDQHVKGGGKLADIYTVYIKAMDESSFFKKILGADPEENAKKTAKKETKLEVVETE